MRVEMQAVTLEFSTQAATDQAFKQLVGESESQPVSSASYALYFMRTDNTITVMLDV